MFSVITNIYNKKTKGPTLMEFFTATVYFGHTHANMLTRVWQQLEYCIDVCTHVAHVEHL